MTLRKSVKDTPQDDLLTKLYPENVLERTQQNPIELRQESAEFSTHDAKGTDFRPTLRKLYRYRMKE